MKRSHWLMILIFFLVIGLVFTMGCAEPKQLEQPDVARYTADQVISVARSTYGVQMEGYCQRYYDGGKPTQPAFNVEYLGKGVWKVNAECAGEYGGRVLIKTYYFHEDTARFTTGR